jgi:hypothetical protein
VLGGRVEISEPVKAAAATSAIVKGMLLVSTKPPPRILGAFFRECNGILATEEKFKEWPSRRLKAPLDHLLWRSEKCGSIPSQNGSNSFAF